MRSLKLPNAAGVVAQHIARRELERHVTAPEGWQSDVMPLGEDAQAKVLTIWAIAAR